MARVLLGVSGGIAAYKACEVCRLLVRRGHEVVPLVTPAAERFVTAETFRALARRPPGDDVYLHLTRADLLVVAPCTANTLAKLAHGLADNVLTEAALAHRGPTLVAPAMNPRMWSHAATRANAETLRSRGIVLIGPDEGETAEGELGVGRMSEPEDIVRAAEELLAGTGPLAGKRVLISAGGTREPIDAVRFVGNRSSGRMGIALAAEARRRGAQVTLLGGEPRRPGAARRRARRDADRRRARARSACTRPRGGRRDHGGRRRRLSPGRGARRQAPEGSRGLDRRARADDGRPGRARAGQGSRARCSSVSRPTRASAASSGHAGSSRTRHADLFVFNDVGRDDIGFDARDNEVTLVSAAGERTVAKAPKDEIAAAILDEVERLVG